MTNTAVDPNKLSKEMLQKWVEDAYWYMLSEYTVAGVAAESPFALELAREWISSDNEMIATAGWSTYANYVTITEDDKLDLNEIRSYLDHIRHHIHNSPNRVRYDMNQFVIAVGSYVDVLHDEAKSVAEAIGKVHVDVGCFMIIKSFKS